MNGFQILNVLMGIIGLGYMFVGRFMDSPINLLPWSKEDKEALGFISIVVGIAIVALSGFLWPESFGIAFFLFTMFMHFGYPSLGFYK